MKPKLQKTLKNLKQDQISQKESSVKKNLTVTKGTKSNQTPVKQGTPLDHARKHLPVESTVDDLRVIGMSIGVTKNMENYESLRVDIWGTTTVEEDETSSEAYERLREELQEVLEETVAEYVDED